MPTKHFYTNGVENKKFYDTDVISEGWHRGRTNYSNGTVRYLLIYDHGQNTYIWLRNVVNEQKRNY